MGYDDSLDVFGLHGVSAPTGTLLTGVFFVAAVSAGADFPNDLPGLIEGNPQQVLIQFYGTGVTLAWSGGVTFLIFKLIGALMPLRVSEMDERQELDVSLHGEALQ